MLFPTRILCGGLLIVAGFGVRRPSGADRETRSKPQADTVTLSGRWRAAAVAPAWNGNFTMTLDLEQLDDSLQGTYEIVYSDRVITSATDIHGHVKGGRMQLYDRYDNFFFDARFDATHLNGRLSHGARERGSAVPITFSRVRDRR
jgi:hypothetical protein